MDDMWLFDNSENVVISDFIQAQALLSERGLSVNDGKSRIGRYIEEDFDVEQMKVDLLRKRRERIRESSSYWDCWDDEDDDDEEGDEEIEQLDQEEQEYLLSLLNEPNLQEEDAELVLSLMRNTRPM